MYLTGRCYKLGIGVAANMSFAAAFFRNAADAGCPAGHREVGLMHSTGFGAEKSDVLVSSLVPVELLIDTTLTFL